ncbi:MAG: alpha/beta hydrolase, partial [Cytophagales bacterium]|nr:alpha/beta hydrolase [Cytophagales bacterium]
INAKHDPLCDHGKLYAQKLRKDGVPATRSVYRKSLHGFFGSGIGESTEALVEASSALRNAFSLPNADIFDEESFVNVPVEVISLAEDVIDEENATNALSL